MLVRINFKLGFYIHGDGESFVEGGTRFSHQYNLL
jgi:hypothetical protein